MRTPTTIDLHCHTTRSDGYISTKDLVTLAKSRSIELMAITDHDLVNREWQKLLAESGILAPFGVEISARDYERGHSFHILYYTLQVSDRVEDALSVIRAGRDAKIQGQCKKLAAAGFTISHDSLVAFAKSMEAGVESLNNKTIADYLLSSQWNREHCKKISKTATDPQGIMDAFLKENSDFPEIGHFLVGDYEMSVEDAVGIAKQDGGFLSIAHPNFSFRKYGGEEGFRSAMRKYAALGITGIEYNPALDTSWESTVRAAQEEIDGIFTFGSDYHADESMQHSVFGETHPSIAGSELLLTHTKRFVERVFG